MTAVLTPKVNVEEKGQVPRGRLERYAWETGDDADKGFCESKKGQEGLGAYWLRGPIQGKREDLSKTKDEIKESPM